MEKDDEYISTVVSVKDILGTDDKPIYIRKITALNNGRVSSYQNLLFLS